MLIDYEGSHEQYLIGRSENGSWLFKPANIADPRSGLYLSTYTAFSNNSLQCAIHIYNSINDRGECVAVHHCLLLTFARKEGGRFLLNQDPNRIAMHIDLGVAAELYSFLMGHTASFGYKATRANRAPKNLEGYVECREGRAVVRLRASTSGASIDLEIDRAAQIGIAAHCLGYGRLLYPSTSDTALQSMLVVADPKSRACADFSSTALSSSAAGLANQAHAEPAQIAHSEITKLHKIIWAIGNQKWPRMQVDALKRIQADSDLTKLQRLVKEANSGDFSGWDEYLI